MERMSPLSSRTAPATLPSVLGDPLAPPRPLSGTIRVHGNLDAEWLPLAGRTVGEIRRRVSSRFGLHSEALALLGSAQVGDDVTVRSGERLSFVNPSGEKGRGAPSLQGGRS